MGVAVDPAGEQSNKIRISNMFISIVFILREHPGCKPDQRQGGALQPPRVLRQIAKHSKARGMAKKTKFLFYIRGYFLGFFLKKTFYFFYFQGPSGIVLQERSLYVVDSKGKYLHQYAVTEKWKENEIGFIYGIRDDDVVIIIFEAFATIDTNSFTKPRIFAFIFLFEKGEFTEQSWRIRLIREMAVRLPILSVPL